MSTDLQKRTIAKTLTWRVTASLTTFIIAWVLTGDLLIGVSIEIGRASCRERV